jgi:uncharacterized peroxidase-related enzyme
MTFIETTPDEQAEGKAAELLEADRELRGYVPNYSRVFATRPAVYEAWQQLIVAIRENMDLRRYELATLAAARQLGSSYCMLAHGSVLAERFFEPSALRLVALDHRSAGLDEVHVALMDLAEKVAADATSVTQEDVDRLRRLGVTDPEIFDIVVTATARCFFSKTLDGLGVRPDAAYREVDPALRDALVVGRPIAES